MAYENIIVEIRDGGVGLITLDRPDTLNALNDALMQEVASALDGFETDDSIGAIVITGSEKAFAAGADIKEMKDMSYMDIYLGDHFASGWERAAACRKPVIAAVAGFALGGGCEFAMMCDVILAADNAKFGQPEINLGIVPGLGGTQRLTRLVGKSKAMELCLTGRMMDAEEAVACNLAARVVPLDELLEEALKTASVIASKSRPSVYMCKEAVNRSLETTLAEGLKFERRLFHSTFATNDQKEGMAAFAEKRKAEWSHS